MSDTDTAPSDRSDHRLTALLYLLHLLGAMTGLTAVAGVAINYAKRASVADSLYASHFDWQIRTFWWAFGVTLAGAALIGLAETLARPLLGAAGALVILVTVVWFVYRQLKGYMWLTAGEPVRRRRGSG
ncbi:MAG: hypothetical protein U5K73_00225 [Halofilum sp. (in: g-proteobacteria)]|nr:hypothetical protein [Halofilum sp. (in: g-proteobacteria)]